MPEAVPSAERTILSDVFNFIPARLCCEDIYVKTYCRTDKLWNLAGVDYPEMMLNQCVSQSKRSAPGGLI